MTTYTMTVLLAVDEGADEHLQSATAVENEVRAWLEGLGATVSTLVVGSLPPSRGLSQEERARRQYAFMRVMERAQQAQKGVLATWLDQGAQL